MAPSPLRPSPPHPARRALCLVKAEARTRLHSVISLPTGSNWHHIPGKQALVPAPGVRPRGCLPGLSNGKRGHERRRGPVSKKGMTKSRELRAAESHGKVFRRDGVSSRTPADPAEFPGRDGLSGRNGWAHKC